MSSDNTIGSGAPFARPLGFTLLMLYGLLSFLTGYQDWQSGHRLATWAAWLLIICGVLMGSAAILFCVHRADAAVIPAAPTRGERDSEV